MKITVKDFNIETGIETIIEREETEIEAKNRIEHEAERTKRVALETEAEAARAVAQAKLAALGLTTDDLKALGL
jgi:hypothetical protein